MSHNAPEISLSAVAGSVHLAENHDFAYHAWSAAGIRGKTLVHVDAHHDTSWLADRSQLTIANFVCQALHDGMLSEVWWVVPDATWTTHRNRRRILSQLRQLVSRYPGRPKIRSERDRYSVVLLGAPFTVCAVGGLPRLSGDPLLDVDVDYFVTPTVGARVEAQSLPWGWPADLVGSLERSGVRSDFVTVAYSVEGGYTPLRWKYLGQELQELFDGAVEREKLQGFELMRRAATAWQAGDLRGADRSYRDAADRLSGSAAPLYHRALLALEQGLNEQARALSANSVALDPSYRTPFGSGGFPALWNRELKEADHQFQQALLLDPADPFGHLGVGLVALRRGDWTKAQVQFETAVQLDPSLVDAYRGLGMVRARLGQVASAIEAYERSLQLSLTGHRPITGPLLTSKGEIRLLDPDHALTHALLARLHSRLGHRRRAIAGYRLSMAAGYRPLAARCSLAWQSFLELLAAAGN